MIKFLKDNLLVIVALLVPIAFVFILFVLAGLPNKAKTNYNFVYYLPSASDYSSQPGVFPNYKIDPDTSKFVIDTSNYYPDNSPSLKGSTAPVTDNTNSTVTYYKVKYYIYNTSDDTSREITDTEFNNLTAISTTTSPDGYYIDPTYSNSGPFTGLFYSDPNGSSLYLRSDTISKELNIKFMMYGYNSVSSVFHLIGWIAK